MPSELRTKEEILGSRVEIPDNVVFRNFVAETVILNLNTGKYHGINPTGGFMLELLKTVGSVEQAAAKLADEYGLAPEDANRDLCDFCLELERRGLIVLRGA
jgi:hypothetical protein